MFFVTAAAVLQLAALRGVLLPQRPHGPLPLPQGSSVRLIGLRYYKHRRKRGHTAR